MTRPPRGLDPGQRLKTDRPTQDVDLFTPDHSEVTRLADALVVALGTEGARVGVERRGPGFTRLAVTVADGRSAVVEVAHDVRIRQAVQLSFGKVLHPDEVAADKTLALFGRAAARDLVDVAALSPSGTRWSSCAIWPRRRTQVSTAGLSRRRWPPPAARADAAFAELELGAGDDRRAPASAARSRAQLLDAAGTSAADGVRSFAVPTPRPDAPDSPRPPRSCCEVISHAQSGLAWVVRCFTARTT